MVTDRERVSLHRIPDYWCMDVSDQESTPGHCDARNSQPPLVLSLKCRKCNLSFKERAPLSNHLKYFCQGGKYADIESIKKSVVVAQNLSVETLREILSSGVSPIGDIPLSTLRDRFRNDANSFARVKTEVLKSRQSQIVSELRHLKAKYSKSVFDRVQQQSKVDGILNDINDERGAEIRSRIERERLRDALKRIEQTDLVALEAEKRREINHLVNEQKVLKQKEISALQDIERLTKMVEKTQDSNKEETEKQTSNVSNTTNDIRLKFARSGEELGRQAALLQMERTRHVAEREQIIRRLKEPMVDDWTQRELLIDRLKREQTAERSRLEQLKDRLTCFREEQKLATSKLCEMDSDVDEEPASDHTEPDVVEWISPLPMASRQQSDPDRADIAPALPGQDGLIAEPNAPGVAPMAKAIAGSSAVHSLEAERKQLLEEIDRLKRQALETAAINNTECSRHCPHRDIQPSARERNLLPVMEPRASPLILQLQQQMAQTQLILQQHQSENARLCQELSDLSSSHEATRFDQQRRDFESTLRLLTSTLQGRLPQTMKPDESKQDLPASPPDSELRKVELEYQAKLARLRFQKELHAEEQELARIREQHVTKAKELDEERRHSEYMAEQRRKLERQRIKQELARDLPLSEFNLPSESAYNPIDGFLIVWDFVYGLDKSVASVKIAHQILDGSQRATGPKRTSQLIRFLGSPKSDVSQGDVVETQPDGPSPHSNRVCLLANTSHISRIPALPSLKLLVEVQSANAGKKQSVGWTLFQVFSDQSSLMFGLWRAPLYTGPIHRDLSPSNLAVNLSACKHPSAQLFLRLAAANESSIQPGGDPNLVMHLYLNQGQARSAASRAHSIALSRPISAKSDPDQQPSPLPVSAAFPDPNDAPQTAIANLMDVGIGIHSAELPAATYARVRVSIGTEFAWTSSYAQVGADGDLGVFRWEEPCTVTKCPIDSVIVIDIVTRLERPTSASSPVFEVQPGETMLGWSVIDAVSSERQLKIGGVDIDLAALPVSPALRPGSNTIQDAVLHVYIFSPESPPVFHHASLLIDESVGSFSVLPWIDYTRPVSQDDPLFERGDGFDVYVDTCRFLPDNVLVSRVRLEMWTCEFGVSVGGPVSKLCSAEGSIKTPKYELRHEYRAHAFNPTCTIEITIEGMERDSKKLKFIGVAALNTFTISGTQTQPSQAQQQEFCLNSGNFQLPLYSELVRSTDLFLASSYSNVPKIPCATVLVRLTPAAKSKDLGEVLSTDTIPESEWVEKGLVSLTPTYSIGKYDSSKCRPSALEVKLYNIISKQESVLVESILDQLGEDAELIVQQGMLAVQSWIEQKFAQLSPPVGQNPQPLSMSRFARYQASVGLCIAVDGAWYVGDGKALPFALYCLSPPGDFYKPFRLTDDVHITGQWDWDSYLRWPTFNSGYTTFRDAEFNEFTVAILDVRLLRGSSVETFAWTILQLFTSDGFVRTGSYQLPLMRGTPPQDILEMLLNERAAAVLSREMSKQGSKRRKVARLPALVFAEPSSVLVRLVDSQIAELGPKKFEFQKMQLEYVDWEKRDKYECDLDQIGRGAMFGLGSKPLKLSTLKMSNEDTLKQFEMATLKTLGTELAIDRLNT